MHYTSEKQQWFDIGTSVFFYLFIFKMLHLFAPMGEYTQCWLENKSVYFVYPRIPCATPLPVSLRSVSNRENKDNAGTVKVRMSDFAFASSRRTLSNVQHLSINIHLENIFRLPVTLRLRIKTCPPKSDSQDWGRAFGLTPYGWVVICRWMSTDIVQVVTDGLGFFPSSWVLVILCWVTVKLQSHNSPQSQRQKAEH